MGEIIKRYYVLTGTVIANSRGRLLRKSLQQFRYRAKSCANVANDFPMNVRTEKINNYSFTFAFLSSSVSFLARFRFFFVLADALSPLVNPKSIS